MADITLPRANQALINPKDGPQGSAGTATREFYNFLRQLASITTDADLQAEIEAILIRLDALEASNNFTIQGQFSVAVVGQPSSGLVALSLRNDLAAPPPSYFYGTDSLGVKGWYPALSNPMTTLGDIITGDVGGLPKRLGIGATGNLLTVVAGEPAWAAPATAGTVTSVAAQEGVETVSGTPITTTGTLRQSVLVNAQIGTSYAIVTGDRAKLVTFSNGSAIAATIAQATGTFGSGWFTRVLNTGAGTVTLTPTTSLINGAATLVLTTGQSALIVSDGTDYQVAYFYTAGGGGLTGFTASLETASPNNTVNISRMLASGGTTNQGIALDAKGSGALMADLPDSTTTGGNVRGTNAVDWQSNRTAAAQVASAANSTIGGGNGNTVSGAQGTIAGGSQHIVSVNYGAIGGGQANSVSASHGTIPGGNSNAVSIAYGTVGGGTNNSATTGQAATVAGGENNICSALRATIGGGFANQANGQYSWIAGGIQAITRATYGAGAYASGQFSAVGDAQHRDFVLRSDTTNATPEAVSTDNSAASATNQIVLPNNSAFMIKGTVVCRQNTTGDTSAWEFTVLIKRGANAAATALVAAATISAPIQDAGAATWTLGITANTTLGGLTITVTGEAAHNIKWVTDVYSCNEVVG